VRVVVKELSKAVSKGVLHKNAASRRIARLSRQVAARKKVATAAGTS
jgi:ribosomal protein S20